MNQTKSNRIIYAAIGAPGSGKTESVISRLPNLLAEGRRVLIALPTTRLINEVTIRMQSLKLPYLAIDHRSYKSVTTKLSEELLQVDNTLIICTHESIRKVTPELLRPWTLIIDELPKVVDYPNYTLTPVELQRVLAYTFESEGQLFIQDGMLEEVEDQVARFYGARKLDSSTLGNSAANIFRLLLCEINVFIDQAKTSDKRCVRAVEEFKSWWKIIASAVEVHVLAANIANTEFEVLAELHGFRFCDSVFTPQRGLQYCGVTIYPVMPQGEIFSKAKVMKREGEEHVIDRILRRVLEHAEKNPLLCANDWAELDNTPGVVYVPVECQGLNAFSSATQAILLFGGNPSPAEKLGLEYQAKKYGRDFKEAFITNRLLERSLQVFTRTAVRCWDNTQDIQVYVQDGRVAEYLRSTYFPHAIVDWSLSTKMETKRDGRRLSMQQEQTITSLIRSGMTTAAISRQTGVSRRKIDSMRVLTTAA
ncbi:DEAD/DEAH box helicase [Pseudomonas sichuanensis]|uniref:DEAD/DEAH box helicase n=1 Tax=Pseudomonas sichuanensis TaxID=2213015 RepID=UPI000DA64CBE|nr:DEAD/DEAH box helicase [Pseudomonas sichuanensis]